MIRANKVAVMVFGVMVMTYAPIHVLTAATNDNVADYPDYPIAKTYPIEADAAATTTTTTTTGNTSTTLAPAMPSTARLVDKKPLLQQAAQYLNNREPQRVVNLLQPKERQYAGQADFDYLLGTALLDAGQVGRAVLVLERVVTVSPNFAGARMELARAYFEAGDYGASEREFNLLLTQQPPANVKQVITRYIDEIDRRTSRYRRNVEAYVQVGLGYDTNANSATADDRFLGFLLEENNQETESGFSTVAAGISLTDPITARLTWQSAASVRHRSNFSAHFVDQTRVAVNTGFAWQFAEVQGAVRAGVYHTELDGSFNYRGANLLFSNVWQITDHTALIVNPGFEAQRFASDISIRDVDRLSLTTGLQFRDIGVRRLRYAVYLIGATDDAVEANSNYSKDTYGLHTAATIPALGPINLHMSATYLESDYDDPFFGFEREDDVTSVAVTAEVLNIISRGWDFHTTAGYRDISSSIDLYDHDGAFISATVTKRFE